MRKLSIFSSVCILVATFTAANAELYREDKNWIVTIERDSKYCMAVQNTNAAGFIGLIKNKEATNVSVMDAKLSWLTTDKDYDGVVLIDRTRWTGAMKAGVSDGRGGLHIYGATDGFMRAFARGNRLAVTVDGTTYGPYTLAGTTKVLTDLDDCVKSLDAPPKPVETVTNTGGMKWVYKNGSTPWSQEDVGKTFKIDDKQLILSRRTRPDGSEGIIVDITDPKKGNISFEIEGGPYASGFVGYVNFDWYETPSIVFSNFTGGTHCCTEVRAVDYSHQYSAKLIQIGTYDSGEIKPDDVDGDGYFELTVPDERFRTLTNFALSSPPTRVLKVSQGKVDDVTFDSAFSRLHEKNYNWQAKICEGDPKENPGACAGMLGSAAILGDFEVAASYVSFEEEPDELSFYKSLCEDEGCKIKRKFSTYQETIVESLKAWGYLNAVPDPDAAGWARKLVGRTFSSGEGSETSCESSPARMDQNTGILGNPVFFSVEYESGCSFATGTMIGNTLAFRGYCVGEGSPPSIEHRIYALEGNTFTRTTFTGFPPKKEEVFKLKECPKTSQ